MNIEAFNKKKNTNSKILDILYDASILGLLPACINSDEVE